MLTHKSRWQSFIGVFIVCLLVLALIPFTPQRADKVQAQSDSTLEIAGLTAPVTVIYDQMGIPHIYAENTRDLFMAQGYVHSSHRMWQMEWWRHLSAGRLSEIAGSATAGNDQFLRTLDYAGAAEKDWEVLSPESKDAVTAYTEGVNAYLSVTEPADAAVEYQFLTVASIYIEPEPWTTNDSMRWLKVMSLSLAGNFENELFRAQVIGAMGPIGGLAIFPDYPFGEHPVIVEPGGVDYTSEAMSYLPESYTDVDFSNVNFELVGNVDLSDPNISPFGRGSGIGSNSWVIGGELTEHGYPMMVNDPHLGIQMPSIWYEVGLHCTEVSDACPYDVVGVSFAGTPGIVIGHNANIAWGFTNVGTDVQDLYILTINPDNPEQYLLDEEWVDFEIVTETINVYGADPIELTVRHSVWGPVMSNFLPTGEQVVALKWLAFDANRSMDALLMLNTASNWDEFRVAASHFDTPAQNMVYADIEGNIGYQMPGLVPIRAEGHDGKVPIDGSVSSNDWQGFVPFDELPSVFNPEAGYIVTANNSVVPADYPYYIDDQWAYGYRAKRIETLIQNDEDGVYSVADMQRIHGDNYDARAENLIPALQSLEFEDEALIEAVAWLSEWDYQAHMDSAEAALFNMFWVELLDKAAADELGFIPSGGDQYIILVETFLNLPQFPLWDSQLTPDVVEDRDDILALAFASAWERMVTEYGEDSSAWSWGAMHTASFLGAPLGQGVDPSLDAMLNSLFNVHVPASGGSAIVNATGYDAAEGFALTSLPSMRQITIVGDWDASLRINTLGQSGRPDSRHFQDQVDMWRFIEYHPEWFSREAVEADAEATWELVPSE